MPARALSLTTFAAVGLVLTWFLVQLARFVGEAPDLDAMISLRESLVFHREGFDGLITERVGTGVHPPALDLLSWVAFTLFGEDPRSQQLIGVALFVVLAAAVERLLSPWLSDGQRVLAVALALVLAFRPPALVLAAVLALLPFIKEVGLALSPPSPSRATRPRCPCSRSWWRCSGCCSGRARRGPSCSARCSSPSPPASGRPPTRSAAPSGAPRASAASRSTTPRSASAGRTASSSTSPSCARASGRTRGCGATLVTGDCDAMKLGEKLHSVGLTPSAYDRGLPAARPLRCVPVDQLPPGAERGPERIALVRTLGDELEGRPIPLAGPSVVVIR